MTLTDHRAIEALAKQDLVWIEDHWGGDLSKKLRDTTTDVMRSGYSRRELGARLADELGEVVDKDAGYWEALADHTVTKSRSIGRVAGFEAAGITRARQGCARRPHVRDLP